MEGSRPENRGETRPSNGFRCKWESLEKKPEASCTQLLPCLLCVPMARFFSEGSMQYWIRILVPLHQNWVPSDRYPQTFSVRIWLERRAARVVLRYS